MWEYIIDKTEWWATDGLSDMRERKKKLKNIMRDKQP